MPLVDEIQIPGADYFFRMLLILVSNHFPCKNQIIFNVCFSKFAPRLVVFHGCNPSVHVLCCSLAHGRLLIILSLFEVNALPEKLHTAFSCQLPVSRNPVLTGFPVYRGLKQHSQHTFGEQTSLFYEVRTTSLELEEE